MGICRSWVKYVVITTVSLILMLRPICLSSNIWVLWYGHSYSLLQYYFWSRKIFHCFIFLKTTAKKKKTNLLSFLAYKNKKQKSVKRSWIYFLPPHLPHCTEWNNKQLKWWLSLQTPAQSHSHSNHRDHNPKAEETGGLCFSSCAMQTAIQRDPCIPQRGIRPLVHSWFCRVQIL